jgi:hypothetical protein
VRTPPPPSGQSFAGAVRFAVPSRSFSLPGNGRVALP